MAIRVVAADDHPIVLDGLQRVFEDEPAFALVAACLTGAEALAAVRHHRPDVLLLDVRMPGNEDLAVLRQLQAEGSSTRVVLLTVGIDPDGLAEAVRLGARGLVLKDTPAPLLLECLRAVHVGGRWFGEDGGEALAPSRQALPLPGLEGKQRLTPRETEVVRLVAQGLRNKQIAVRLSMAEATVRNHLRNACEKLGVSTRTEVALLIRHRGLV